MSPLPRLWITGLALYLGCSISWSAAEPPKETVPAPEFTQTEANQWINSKPLTLEDLRGQVVLLDIWTFGCGNCRRSIPWLKYLENQYKDTPFRIIGIHSPEFPWERVKVAVRAQVKSLGITHAVMLDNDMAYWNALGNRFWPAFYLMDQQGNFVAGTVGELHKGDQRALAMEQAIQTLLETTTK